MKDELEEIDDILKDVGPAPTRLTRLEKIKLLLQTIEKQRIELATRRVVLSRAELDARIKADHEANALAKESEALHRAADADRTLSEEDGDFVLDADDLRAAAARRGEAALRLRQFALEGR